MSGFKARWETQCNFFHTVCNEVPIVEPTFTMGDGTVPTLSAGRTGAGLDYNTVGATISKVVALNEGQDHGADHNGMMTNTSVHDLVLQYLSTPLDEPGVQAAALGVGAAAVGDPDPYHYITVSGAQVVEVTDSAGNSTAPLNSVYSGTVPGVDTYWLGPDVWMVTVPVSASSNYSTLFDSTGDPVSVEIRIGTGDTTTRSIRYRDIVLPAGVSAKLSFMPSGPQDLAYDSDGDGTFDTTVEPTVDVTGPAAQDTDPPVISVHEDIQGGSSRITLSANDPSGLSRLMVSLDGTNYEEYTGPLTLVSQRTPVVYAFADDNLANRATLVHELRKNATPIPAMTWWGLAGLAMLVAGLGYLRVRRARRSVSTADRI